MRIGTREPLQRPTRPECPMTTDLHTARTSGERIGHLSRHARTDMLCEELSYMRCALHPGPGRWAFRKSFFGAGGTKEHWDRYVTGILDGTDAELTSPARVRTAVEPNEDRLWQELVRQALPLAATDAEVTSTDHGPETPADLWAAVVRERVRAQECELAIGNLSEHVVGAQVQGVFGGGEHGGGALVERVRAALEAGASGLLLDMSGVSAVRLDCLGPVIACQVNVEGVGGRVAVVMPEGAAGGLMEATGLARRVRCFDDAIAAAAYLLAQEPD